MTDLIPEEFLRELNYKARLLRQAEVLRKSNNVQYSKLCDKYNAEHSKLNRLSINQLKEFVEEI